MTVATLQRKTFSRGGLLTVSEGQCIIIMADMVLEEEQLRALHLASDRKLTLTLREA